MQEEEIELRTLAGHLSGTIAVPRSPAPWPLALLIPGSGPTDRDGRNPLLAEAEPAMLRLAESLADSGIASLRYDKRGVGASVHPGLREDDLRFRHLVEDAIALAAHAARDRRFSELLLVGHSEGALIASLAAREADAAAVVSIAGAGRRASELMRAQLQGRLPELLELQALLALEALAEEMLVADPPEALTLLFRPSVQPYLVSWFRYDPAEVVADLPVPLLLVHGMADTQVPPANARWLHDARPDAKLLLVDGMDHLLAIRGDTRAGAARVAGEVAALARELHSA